MTPNDSEMIEEGDPKNPPIKSKLVKLNPHVFNADFGHKKSTKLMNDPTIGLSLTAVVSRSSSR